MDFQRGEAQVSEPTRPVVPALRQRFLTSMPRPVATPDIDLHDDVPVLKDVPEPNNVYVMSPPSRRSKR